MLPENLIILQTAICRQSVPEIRSELVCYSFFEERLAALSTLKGQTIAKLTMQSETHAEAHAQKQQQCCAAMSIF